MQVNILEAKNRLSQLIKSAQAGEEVIIANRGTPVARLVSVECDGAGDRTKGNGRRILEWLERHPVPAYARRSSEEIDAYIAEERASWDDLP
jgi:prevent-host-death family protein